MPGYLVTFIFYFTYLLGQNAVLCFFPYETINYNSSWCQPDNVTTLDYQKGSLLNLSLSETDIAAANLYNSTCSIKVLASAEYGVVATLMIHHDRHLWECSDYVEVYLEGNNTKRFCLDSSLEQKSSEQVTFHSDFYISFALHIGPKQIYLRNIPLKIAIVQSTATGLDGPCDHHWGFCKTANYCIRYLFFCDGIANCPYDADEECTKTPPSKVYDIERQREYTNVSNTNSWTPARLGLICSSIALVIIVILGVFGHLWQRNRPNSLSELRLETGSAALHGSSSHTLANTRLDPTVSSFGLTERELQNILMDSSADLNNCRESDQEFTCIGHRELPPSYSTLHTTDGDEERGRNGDLPPSYHTLFPSV